MAKTALNDDLKYFMTNKNTFIAGYNDGHCGKLHLLLQIESK